MANANLPKPTNGIGSPFGDLSPDDAERFAAAFRPMWELDDAPFAATPANMSQSEVRQLGSVGANADLMAGMHAPILAPAPMPTANPAMAKPSRPQGRPPGPRAAAAVAQRAIGRDASVDLDLPPIRKSNKGLFLAAGGIIAGLALFFGVRAALSGPDAAPATLTTATPTSHEEPKIPPPPAPDPPAAVTAAAAATTPDPKPEPPRVDPPKPPPPVQAARPEPPPPRAAAPHYNPPPRAPAPPPAKKPTSGIVRDNPF